MSDTNRPNNDATVAFDADIGGTGGEVEFDAAPTTDAGIDTEKAKGAAQTLKDEATKFSQQAGERARHFAGDGKEKASGALDEFSKLIDEAGDTVDEKLGEQYGQYAHSAAQALSGFSDQLRDKDIDELIADAREFVRKSPAIAIGSAAALGFVLARLVKAGIDATADAADKDARPNG